MTTQRIARRSRRHLDPTQSQRARLNGAPNCVGHPPSEEVKNEIVKIGINKCARESGFDRKNFIRKLARDIPVKRNSYNEFLRWLQRYKSNF